MPTEKDVQKTFMLEDAQIIWRNFSGEARQYNVAGNREFSIVLTPEEAAGLAAEGWNVKEREPREEGDEPLLYITVTVGYKFKPPRVTMVTSRARTPLDEERIGVLDWADIEKVDLIARAYEWSVNGKSGIKAYLQTLFVIINEDELELKYAINEVRSD